MESMKFDEDIIRNQNLVFVDQVNNDCICTICKKIQYNAYTAPCAHGFCKTCIEHHLAVCSIKRCTGDEVECKEIDLEMDSNVNRCPRTNRRIENLRVKCNNSTCEKIVRLREMKEHLNTCGNRNTNCPYTFIGCSSGLMTEKDIRNHLLDESIIHADLFSETIKRVYDLINEQKQEINNVNGQVNQEIETVRNGNSCLTGRIENIESTLQEYFGIIGIKSSENNGIKEELLQIKEENKRRGDEIEVLKDENNQKEINKRYNDEIEVLKDENKDQKEINKSHNNEINIMKDENKQQKEINKRYNDEIKVLKDENKQQNEINKRHSDEINVLKDESKQQKDVNKTMSEEMNTFKEFSKQILEDIEVMKKKNKDLVGRNVEIENEKSIDLPLVPTQYNLQEVEVIIENFGNKIKLLKNHDEVREIDKFDRYLNGYKICFKFSVKRENLGFLFVFIKLSMCKGEFDKLLSWPCDRIIEVVVIGRDGRRWGQVIFDYEERDKWRNKVVGQGGKDSEEKWIIGGYLLSEENYKNKILIENCLKMKIKIN